MSGLVRESLCSYCGLPLPRGAQESPSPDRQPPSVPSAPRYCCLGCRFAAAVAAEQGEAGQARWTLTRLGVAIFFTMNVMVFSMALWSQEVYGSSPHATAHALHELFRWASLLFAAPVLLLLGGPLAEGSLEALRRRVVSTDLLLLAGVVAAFVFSLRSVLAGAGHIYFEVASVVLVAVTLGRWLEATGRLKTTQALRSLEKLLPATVRRVRAIPRTFPDSDRCADGDACEPPAVDVRPAGWLGHEEITVPLAEVTVRDLVRVLPGERIPVDGVIRRNHAAIDEQIVTGESQPSIKEPGDTVLAGTLNLDGDLWIEVTAHPRDGTLQRLIDRVVQAALARGQLQRTADRVARFFLPAVVLIALTTFAAHAWQAGVEQGVLTALAVVLIACPCALGIATPMAIWVAMGQAARGGVLFRNGDAIQRLARIRAVCFDKTGTLTTGESQVTEFLADPATSRETVLSAASALASASTHGLSCAVRQFVDDRRHGGGVTVTARPMVRDVKTFPGRGLRGHVEDLAFPVFLGSPRWMTENGLQPGSGLCEALDRVRQSGVPFTCIGWEERVRGAFVFREQLRPETRSAIEELRRQPLHVCVLTGDHAARGALLQTTLALDVASELLPEDKAEALAAIRRQHGPVAMVGDGINDAPALASADVGIALGCGADVSRDAAHVCLLGNDLRRVAWSVRLARRTVRTVYYNLFWAFAYNGVGIAIAAAGWLNPIWAAAAMVLSSLFVVSNSLRLAADSDPGAVPAHD